MALDFLAGCLGGCAGIVVGYPFDTIKVHIQTQDHRNPKYKGTWHCFRTLLAKDSVRGLYRGMSSPMAGVAAINAIVFGAYGQTQRLLHEETSLYGHFLAGAAAGLAQAPVCSPIELAKTRMQLQGGGGSSGGDVGPVQCLRRIHRAEGMRGVFSGFGITVAREAPSYGIYFFTYEALTRSDAPISTVHMLMAGGLAGTASWVLSYPLDVVKSRLQADTEARYSGALDCFRKSVATEGYGCMFRGLNSTILRAFPTNAATFAVVTWTLRLLGAEQPRPAPQPQQTAAARVSEPATVRRRLGQQDRYDEWEGHSLQKLGAATGGYLHQLANASLALVPEAAAAGIQAGAVGQYHFDEAHHFEWAGEIIHY